jgi:hypothetical protein
LKKKFKIDENSSNKKLAKNYNKKLADLISSEIINAVGLLAVKLKETFSLFVLVVLFSGSLIITILHAFGGQIFASKFTMIVV